MIKEQSTLFKLFFWVVRIIPAVIFLQTLYFKFSGSEESVYIFTTMGMEPWGRYMIAIAELTATILLLIPRTTWLGATLALGIITGAIGSHLTLLGIEVMGDGGLLFILAITVFIFSLTVLYLTRKENLIFRYLEKFH